MKRLSGVVLFFLMLFAAGGLHASGPDIYVYPDFINFGEVRVDGVSSARNHFYIFNKGDQDLIIPGLRITATPWIHFNLDVLSFSYAMECGGVPDEPKPALAAAAALVAAGEPVILPPGGSCTVWVTFKPKAKQPGGASSGGDQYKATLEITSSDPDESLSMHRMFGVGLP